MTSRIHREADEIVAHAWDRDYLTLWSSGSDTTISDTDAADIPAQCVSQAKPGAPTSEDVNLDQRLITRFFTRVDVDP